MNFDWKTIIDALQWLTALAAFVFAWLAGRRREVAQLQERATAVEARIGQMLGRDDLHALDIRVEALHGEIQALNGHIDGVRRQIGALARSDDMMLQHLLKGEK